MLIAIALVAGLLIFAPMALAALTILSVPVIVFILVWLFVAIFLLNVAPNAWAWDIIGGFVAGIVAARALVVLVTKQTKP